MIISESLTIGQITFILRVTVQILAYGGPALISVLILSNAPRVALIETHDVINRLVGASTANQSSAKWVFNRFRNRRKDPISSTNLLISLFLSLSYTAFVALSDIGYLGLYACSIPGPTILDSPASVTSDDAALALLSANMVNGIDPSAVKAYRCNAVELLHYDVTLNGCTAWHNSTYADKTWFEGINSTDTAVLMPRQLTLYDYTNTEEPPLNSYRYGPTTQRLTTPTIVRGLAIDPHETGLRVVIGVPQLARQRKVELSKVMALEVDVGCMALGINSRQRVGGLGNGIDAFATTGNWRKYTGPDYLRDVLANTTDIIRQKYLPFFNESILDSNGFIYGINFTEVNFSDAANIDSFGLPGPLGYNNTQTDIIGNCTQDLQLQLGVSAGPKDGAGRMCGLFAMGGSFSEAGLRYLGLSRMVCATATQVNMVDATIVVDAENEISLNLNRLPSDLNYLRADYWGVVQRGNDPPFISLHSHYDRFTLADNPTSPTTHFITQDSSGLGDLLGPGSGANPLSLVGDLMLSSPSTLDAGSGSSTYAALSLLDEGFDDLDMVNTSTVRATQWSGQIGASFIFGSVGYNGWAARMGAQVRVLSTGGKGGSCFKPYYAFGFAPLVLSATGMIIWAIMMFVRTSLFSTTSLRHAYGGLRLYVDVMCPGASVKDTLLTWEKEPQPHLQVVSKGDQVPLLGSCTNGSETALGSLKA